MRPGCSCRFHLGKMKVNAETHQKTCADNGQGKRLVQSNETDDRPDERRGGKIGARSGRTDFPEREHE